MTPTHVVVVVSVEKYGKLASHVTTGKSWGSPLHTTPKRMRRSATLKN